MKESVIVGVEEIQEKYDGRMVLKNESWNLFKKIIIRNMFWLGVCEMAFIICQFGTIDSIGSLCVSNCDFAILNLVASNTFDEYFVVRKTHRFVECTGCEQYV